MFIVLSSCSLCSIMVIQSYIIYRGKIRPQSSQGEKRPGDEVGSNRLKFRLLLEGDI